MRIRRVRIQDFRKLRGPVCLEGLGDGLTVIAGDNEDGKSTVLEAIRAALFCRHRANDDYVRALAPFGCSGARPVVELDFVLNGGAYHLRKAFCQKPHEALLMAGGMTFKGDAAEEELSRILGLANAKRGAVKPEEQGVWGLFWVSQGTAFEPECVPSDNSRATLSGALEDEMGRVFGGDGAPALLARIRQRCDALFTESRNVARGDLKLAREQHAAAAGQVAELEAQLADYQGKVAELQRLREERLRHDREQTLAQAEAALRTAAQEQQRIEGLRQRLQQATGEAELAHAKFDQARGAWRQRYEMMQAAKAAADNEQALASEVAEARRRLEPLEAQLSQTEAALAAARQRQETAEARFAAADLVLRVARIQHDLQTDSEALRKAEAADAAAAAADMAAAAIPVADTAIAALRAGVAKAREAGARLDAAETQVMFSPEPGRRIFQAEHEIPAGQPLRLATETLLRLEGFGSIVIRPGGEDLGERQRAATVAGAAVAQMLATFGVDDPATAEAAHAQRCQYLADAGAERRAAGTFAPRGLAVLRAAVAAKTAELASLLADAGAEPTAVPAAEAAVDAARVERDAAVQLLAGCQQARDRCAQDIEQARSAEISARTRYETAVAHSRQCQQALTLEQGRIADHTLLTTLKDEEANAAAADALLQQSQHALQSCEPEAAAQQLAAAEQRRADTQACLKRLDDDMQNREGELRGLGHHGVEDELTAARGLLERAERKLAAVEQDAAALRLLYETLRTAEQEAKRSFAEPITRRMAPYLRTLFPGCELAFAPDTLQLRHLRRDGLDEPFGRLSVGTREQLAVLTRLAFAELLSERGQPATVILDDALVYSDRARLQRMQQELLRAAERLQVLVLTCRPDDYACLDAPMVRLADCIAGEALV